MSKDPASKKTVPIVSSGGTSRSGLAPGLVLSERYELLEIRGAGGMGEVWRARHLELQREVAVKVLPAEIAGDVAATKRLRREAGRLFDLRHPGIAAVMDFGVHPEGPRGPVAYLVMELMVGPTLREHMADTGRLDLEQAVALLRPIADALDFAHGKKFVHLDVKPANVLFTAALEAGGEPKLIDFGIAHEIEETMAMTGIQPVEPVEVMGTPGYMSPEQFQAKRPRPSMDVWACAVMAYQMLADRMPFRGAPSEKRRQILQEDPDDVEVDGIQEEHSTAVSQVLRWGMRKEPKKRPATVREFVDALEGAGQGRLPPGLPLGAPRPPADHPETEAVLAEPTPMPMPAAPPAPAPPPGPTKPPSTPAQKVASSPGVAQASGSLPASRMNSMEFETPAGGSALSGRAGVILVVVVAIAFVAGIQVRDAQRAAPPVPSRRSTTSQTSTSQVAVVRPAPSPGPLATTVASVAPASAPPPSPSPAARPSPSPSPSPEPAPSPEPPPPSPSPSAKPEPPPRPSPSPIPSASPVPPPRPSPKPKPKPKPKPSPSPSPSPNPTRRTLPVPTRVVRGDGTVDDRSDPGPRTPLPTTAYKDPVPTAPPTPTLRRPSLEDRLKAARYTLVSEKNRKGFAEWQNGRDGSVMILLPPSAEKPGLLVGKFEVTVQQFQTFLKQGGGGSRFEPYDIDGLKAQGPVLFLHDVHAKAYARWAGGKVPTEQEWLRAALGDEAGSQSNPWPWGHGGPSYRRANYDSKNKRNKDRAWRIWVKPVTDYSGSESPIGARQMAGNAAEYVVLLGGRLGLKGGAWCNHPDSMRVGADAVEPGSKNDWKAAGFRLFADLP